MDERASAGRDIWLSVVGSILTIFFVTIMVLVVVA
jgi:hypothetical protein